MSFEDRVVEHPNRWTLTNVDDPTDVATYDVVRDEGVITNPGTPLNADNLNLEIAAAAQAQMAAFGIDQNDNVHVKNIQCGRATVTVSAANTNASKTVTFATPFSAVPSIVVTPHTGIPGRVSVAINNPSTTGFTIVINRDTATNTNVHWIAMI